MTADVSIPGGRSVRGTIDRARSESHEANSDNNRTDSCVVACPPHPQYGGHRSDARLEAISNELIERGIDCLRIDYGNWDEGYGEREDACNAVRWADERYDRVGLSGYSFGGAIALMATGRVPEQIDGVATLAPASKLGADEAQSAVATLDELLDTTDLPVQIVSGERDSTVDSTPLIDRLREESDTGRHEATVIPADHFFVGQHDRIASLAGGFLADVLDRRK
jgi:hypothetical protein